MFGHVQANSNDLSQQEKLRYRSFYCGLCHTLGERYGIHTRLSLTYDLTFLTLLLTSLYEPQETSGESRCIVHPCKKHTFMVNQFTEYAADMTIALTYYKCLDDWNDDHEVTKKCYAASIEKAYRKVKALWPEQCRVIETELNEITRLESDTASPPDLAANCFGRLMEALFVFREDNWEEYLRVLGHGLGRYIYFADAAVDAEQDRKNGSYNPFNTLSATPEEFKPMLQMILGETSQAFERLPLVQDDHLLRNILYSGIWIKYNRAMQEKREKKNNDR